MSVRHGGSEPFGTFADALRHLVGLPMASVEFVQDYVQLHFDGPTMTAYTLPTMSLKSSVTLAWARPDIVTHSVDKLGPWYYKRKLGQSTCASRSRVVL